jgi:hypothetical protein
MPSVFLFATTLTWLFWSGKGIASDLEAGIARSTPDLTAPNDLLLYCRLSVITLEALCNTLVSLRGIYITLVIGYLI